MAQVIACVGSARAFIHSLRETEPEIYAAFQPGGGISESVIVWQDDQTLCRCRPDRLANDHELIIDVKSTATSANPIEWIRQLLSQGSDLSAAFYRRGCEAVLGVVPKYVFLVIEVEPPYLCSLIGTDPSTLELGREKTTVALDRWQECVRRNSWPSYPPRVCFPEVPNWESSRWAQQQDAMAAMSAYGHL